MAITFSMFKTKNRLAQQKPNVMVSKISNHLINFFLIKKKSKLIAEMHACCASSVRVKKKNNSINCKHQI